MNQVVEMARVRADEPETATMCMAPSFSSGRAAIRGFQPVKEKAKPANYKSWREEDSDERRESEDIARRVLLDRLHMSTGCHY